VQQCPGNLPCTVRADDAREETLSCVGRTHATRLLVPVQSQGVGRQFFAPERLSEPPPQRFGLPCQLCRQLCPTEDDGQCRAGSPGSINITLNFTHSDRTMNERAVRVEDGGVGVLPAL